MGTNASNVEANRSIPREEQYAFQYSPPHESRTFSLTPNYTASQLGLPEVGEEWLTGDQSYDLFGSPSPPNLRDSPQPLPETQGSNPSTAFNSQQSVRQRSFEGFRPRQYNLPSHHYFEPFSPTSDASSSSDLFLHSLVTQDHSNHQHPNSHWSTSPILPNPYSSTRPPLQPPERGGFVDLTAEVSPQNMAPTKKRSPLKRESSSVSGGNKRRKISISKEGSAQTKLEETEIEEVNLLDIDDDSGLSALLQKQRADEAKANQKEGQEMPRISKLQCIICLETPTDLTATSCGHLFCHTCVMEALIAGESQAARAGESAPATKSKCPVCRQRISREASKFSSKASSKPGFLVPLELKLQNKASIAKGKQPVKAVGSA
ncbi:MAG: SUMO-targeted ubiquitin ligase complex subunit slx8 [Candelina mexicana]|nr:MAG: SUMO-targeted ubiquitin ligase complex subunit slx8 [Candelina mexicana]